MAEPKERFKRDDGSSYPAWTAGKLGDITEKVDRKAPRGSTAPVMMVSQGNGFIYQANKYSRENAGQSLKNYTLLKQGEFAYNHGASKAKPYGVAYCLTEEPEARVPFVYHTFKLTDGVNPYWHEALNTSKMDRQLKRMVSSGARMDGLLNINYETYMDVSINIPCKEEQQKIADFLSSVDEVITASEQEVANLETQKKAVMKKIFSQEVRFKRADGSDFPEWEERDLVELFPYIRNGFVGTITDFFTEKENGIRYLQGTNIHDGIISDNAEFYVTREFHQKHINNELKEDDIIMVQSGHVGDCAVVGKKYAGANCHALIIMSNAGNCCSEFYVDYFHSPDGLREISIKATGNTVKHILASVMQGFRVPYPCLEEQRLIADFLSNFDEAIAAAKKELELWKELKKGLLQQMFV